MTATIRSHWLNGLVAFLLFVLVVIAFSGARQRIFQVPPVSVSETIIEKTKLRVNEQLSIRVVMDKRRVCRMTLDQFISRSDSTVVYRQQVIADAAPIGNNQSVRYLIDL